MVHTSAKSVGTSLPSADQFQALRDLLENYPDSESCSSASASPYHDSFEPKSASGDVQLQGPLPRNQVRDWIVYSRRKNLRKGEVSHVGGNISSRRSEYVMAEEVGMRHGGQIEQASDEAPLSNGGYDHLFDSLGYGPYYTYVQENGLGDRR